ncbi:hypothetical protein D1007_35701 [Hordeum vulgare]|nr:hypothetical protein D1007_35701 [Hordeum vulgare]
MLATPRALWVLACLLRRKDLELVRHGRARRHLLLRRRVPDLLHVEPISLIVGDRRPAINVGLPLAFVKPGALASAPSASSAWALRIRWLGEGAHTSSVSWRANLGRLAGTAGEMVDGEEGKAKDDRKIDRCRRQCGPMRLFASPGAPRRPRCVGLGLGSPDVISAQTGEKQGSGGAAGTFLFARRKRRRPEGALGGGGWRCS